MLGLLMLISMASGFLRSAHHFEVVYSSLKNFMHEFLFGRSAREHFLKLLGCVMNDIEHNFVDTVSAERIL